MKFTFAAIGLVAAVANANSNVNHLFPRSNGTEPQTTMTVTATDLHTVISCAPTVTNCPADASDISKLPQSQRTTAVVTDTVVLTTTVCPVASAPGLSASIVASHSAGKITGSTPTPSSAAVSTPPYSLTTATSDVVSDSTVTLTSGSEVITTTIRSTKKTTVTITMSADHGSGGGSGSSVEPTTTVTETGTRTVTVTLAAASKTGIGSNKSETDSDSGSGSGSGSGSDSSAGESGSCNNDSPKTVTVTAAPSTVTLPATTVYVTKDSCVSEVPDASAAAAGDDAEDCTTDSLVTVKHTVTVLPYRHGHNGTYTPTPTPTPTPAPGPSGFAKLRRFI